MAISVEKLYFKTIAASWSCLNFRMTEVIKFDELKGTVCMMESMTQ